MSNVWDERYRTPEYVYGTSPNDFLVSVAESIPRGPVLCLAEGEGRNAVYLAKRGHAVTAVDQSAVGLAKAEQLAARSGVHVAVICADVSSIAYRPSSWGAIVAIFMHLPPDLRTRTLQAAAGSLRPGGVLVLESYRPKQLEYRTGGPNDPSLLPTLDDLRTDLAGLDMVIARERDREVHEGSLHHGMSAVVQVLARRPLDSSGTVG